MPLYRNWRKQPSTSQPIKNQDQIPKQKQPLRHSWWTHWLSALVIKKNLSLINPPLSPSYFALSAVVLLAVGALCLATNLIEMKIHVFHAQFFLRHKHSHAPSLFILFNSRSRPCSEEWKRGMVYVLVH